MTGAVPNTIGTIGAKKDAPELVASLDQSDDDTVFYSRDRAKLLHRVVGH